MKIARRQLLGAGALLGACGRPAGCTKPAVLPPGRLVGQLERVGHGLRSMGPSSSWDSSAPVARHDVIVVGAGVAGLSCARALRSAGQQDVLVLELDERVGGTATWGETSATAHPWGAHYVTMPMPHQREMLAFLHEIGAIQQDAQGGWRGTERTLCREPEERLFLGGLWHEGLWPTAGASVEDVEEFVRFKATVDTLCAKTRGDGSRFFRFPLQPHASGAAGLGDEGKALDALTATGWLEQEGFRSARLHWMVDYACRDDYGCRARDTSALAALAYFAARQSPGAGEAQEVLTWPEGNGHLVQALARGTTLRTGMFVTEVHEDGRLCALGADGQRHQFQAGQVVMAVPTFIAGRLLRNADGTFPRKENDLGMRSNRLSYAPWWVANLQLREHPQGEGAPIAWDNVIYDSPSVGYVVATHQQGADSGPTVLSYYMPMADGDPAQRRRELLSASYEQLAEQCLADLERAHAGLRALVEHIEIRKWGHAMVRPVPGLLTGADTAALGAPVGRVQFAHTDLSGVALFDEAFEQGLRAADRVAHAGRPPKA